MGVVVLVVGVLHLLQAGVILLPCRQTQVVGRQAAAHRVGGVGEHALVEFELVGVAVAGEQFAQVFLTKIACVVQYHVEQNFHPAGMGGIDERLEGRVAALVAVVNA